MDDISTFIGNANKALSGEQPIKVTIDTQSALLLAVAVLLAVFMGSLLANALTR